MHMLMQFAHVTADGKFERVGSEILMYAAMLLMRGMLPLLGAFYLSVSTTIAIRYSCVRRQTPNTEGYICIKSHTLICIQLKCVW